jgi:hypothetical protein
MPRTVGAWTKLSWLARTGSPRHRQRIFAKMVGQNCPHRRYRIQCRFAFSREQDLLGRAVFQRRNETRGSSRNGQFASARKRGKFLGTSIATDGRLTPNVCLPTPSLPSPAPEILDYLARHPEAQDTIDGILHWWVLDAYIRNWAPKIAKTVAQLVEQGFLEQSQSADGKVFYRVSPHYLATLQQRPPRDRTSDATP